MAAINLKAAAKSAVNSKVNTAISTVSAKATASISGKIPGGSLSTNKVGAALLGGAIGGLLDGAKGAAIGGLLGGSGGLGSIQNKLQGLIGDAFELQGLLNEPLKLVERGLADLSGLTGESNSLIQSQIQELSEISAFSSFVDSGFKNSFQGNKSGNSAVPNPLRDHSSFNYVITLGILDAAEYNNPEIYRSNGFKNIILQSSGGGLDKRYQVFEETGGGASEHAEYYIDDIEFEAIVAPNPNTRVTPGGTMSFTVIEPYSMGNFVQAIIGSAATAGYTSYNQAPFCMMIDFKGWNLDGVSNANFIQRPMYLPVQITNMDFNVTGAGSTYQVTAVPMSETGLADNINKIKTPVKATGLRLHEVLETNDNSVTSAVNRHIEGLEEAGAIASYDRYIIAFPADRDTLQNALQKGTVTESAFTTSPEEQAAQRKAGTADPALKGSFNPTIITITPPNNTYAILKSFAENTDLMNEIGLSSLNEDTNAPGNSSEADVSQVTNPETDLVDTQSEAAQPADKARDFQFSQGEQFTSIIEKTVLQSLYAAERSTEGAKNGLNKWFKIDTQVFLDESPITEAQLGRRPKVYVYSVFPYEVDEAVHITGDRRASNTQGLRASAAKTYNYIYSGKNEDVLSFDLNFNQAFLMTANSDFGMSSGSSRDPDAGANAAAQDNGESGVAAALPDGKGTTDDPAGELGLDSKLDLDAGGHSTDVRRKIAEMFHHQVTNIPSDMVQAEMEIMGDPYFIPQETGNYVARRGALPSITEDGTMAYQTGPVFAIVNFRSPFDYQIRGATMEFPQIVPGFSGLFSIWAVTNRFSSGKFTQILKMTRRRGQDDESVHGNSGSILPENSANPNPTTTQSDGTVGGQRPGIDCFPAPTNDDIRKINPAIGADVAAQATSALKDLEDAAQQVTAEFKTAIEGVDFGVAKLPDLTKIIPGAIQSAISDAAFGAIASKVGGVGGLALGSLASDAIGGIGAAAAGGYGQTSLQAGLATGQKATNAVTASRAANEKIASVSGAAKAKASSLLGGPI